MAGEAEIGRGGAVARIEVVHVRRIGVGEGEAVADEAEPFQHLLQVAERAAFRRGHARAADQVARQFDRVDQIGQSRKSSLIEVLARVPASTRLMITAQ